MKKRWHDILTKLMVRTQVITWFPTPLKYLALLVLYLKHCILRMKNGCLLCILKYETGVSELGPFLSCNRDPVSATVAFDESKQMGAFYERFQPDLLLLKLILKCTSQHMVS